MNPSNADLTEERPQFRQPHDVLCYLLRVVKVALFVVCAQYSSVVFELLSQEFCNCGHIRVARKHADFDMQVVFKNFSQHLKPQSALRLNTDNFLTATSWHCQIESAIRNIMPFRKF